MGESTMRTPPKVYAVTKPRQISWMAWTVLIELLLIFNVDSVDSEADACKNYQLVDMHQGRRQSTYQSTTGTAPEICDDDLDPNTWVRLARDGKSYQLTKADCVLIGHCGTSGPLWIQESSPIPSGVGAEVTAKVCTNYGFPGQCCNVIGYATIRLCEDQTGDKFYVYKLPNPPGCYSGYCVDPIPGECEPNFKKGPDGNCISALASTTDSNMPPTTPTTTVTTTVTTTTTSSKGVGETDAPSDEERWNGTPETDRAKTNAGSYNNETDGGKDSNEDWPSKKENGGSGKEDVGDDSQKQKDDGDDGMLLKMVIVGVVGLVLITGIMAAAFCFVKSRKRRPDEVSAVTKKDNVEEPGNVYQTSEQPRETGDSPIDNEYTEITDPDIVQGLPKPAANDDNSSYDSIEILNTERPTGNVNMAFENEYLEIIA